MTKRAGLTDDDLIAKGVRHADLKAQARKLLDEASKLQDEVLADVARRKSTVQTTKGNMAAGFGQGGVRILVLTNPTTTYDPVAARKRVGEGRFRKIAHWVITKKSVDAALEAKVLTEEDVDAFSTVTPSEPFIRVFVS